MVVVVGDGESELGCRGIGADDELADADQLVIRRRQQRDVTGHVVADDIVQLGVQLAGGANPSGSDGIDVRTFTATGSTPGTTGEQCGNPVSYANSTETNASVGCATTGTSKR